MESLPLSERPYEEQVARTIAHVLEGAGLLTQWWGVEIPADAAWPALLGPDLPLDRDECVVLSPRPSAPSGYNLLTPVQLRMRTRAAADPDGELATLRLERGLHLERIRDTLQPNGRPLAHVRHGRVGVSRVTYGSTLFYDYDRGNRLGASIDLLVLSRRQRG